MFWKGLANLANLCITLDPVLEPYLEGWKLFIEQSGFIIQHSEQMLYSQKYKFAGTLDRFGIFNYEETVLDIKSGVHTIAHGPQLAAYEQLCKENKLTEKRRLKRLTVKLLANGKYELKEHEARQDFPVFLNAIAIYNFKTNLR